MILWMNLTLPQFTCSDSYTHELEVLRGLLCHKIIILVLLLYVLTITHRFNYGYIVIIKNYEKKT